MYTIYACHVCDSVVYLDTGNVLSLFPMIVNVDILSQCLRFFISQAYNPPYGHGRLFGFHNEEEKRRRQEC